MSEKMLAIPAELKEQFHEKIADSMGVPRNLVYGALPRSVRANYSAEKFSRKYVDDTCKMVYEGFRLFLSSPDRRLKKQRRALKNAMRPGLSDRKRKHWKRVARKWGIQFYVQERRGITVGNLDGIAKVRINTKEEADA